MARNPSIDMPSGIVIRALRIMIETALTAH
jgi:hypothetical protein